MRARQGALRRSLSCIVAAALTIAGTATVLAVTEQTANAALDTKLYGVAADQKLYSFDEATGAATPLSVAIGFQSAAIARQPGTNLLYIYEQTKVLGTGFRIATYNVATNTLSTISTTFPVGLLRLAFRSDGELYGGVNNQLYHLSSTTGAVLDTTTLTGVGTGGGDLTFGPDGTMYVVENSTLWTFAPYATSPPSTLAPATTVTIAPGTNTHPGLSFGQSGRLFTVDAVTTTSKGVTTTSSSLTYVNPSTGAETRFASTGISFLDLTATTDRPPTARTIAALTTPRDVAITTDVLTGSADPDGDPVTLLSAGSAVNGTVTIDAAAGTVTFTPTPGYSGAASYTFTLSDGNGGTVSQTVSVTVGPNTAPVAVNDTVSTPRGTAKVVPVLANDTDANSDPLTVTAVGAATHGTVTLSGGVVTYTPTAAYEGPDAFTYTISDGHGGTASASVAVTVTHINVAPAYTAAVTNTSQTIAAAGTPTALAATDPESDPLTYTVTAGSLPAGITLNANGTFSGTATGIGSSTVTVTVSDGNGGSALTTLTIVVQNGPPVAVTDTSTTLQDTAVAVPVLTNDTDPNGDTVALVSASGATNGTVTADVAAGTVTFTPTTGYSGAASFSYTINDGRGQTASGTVNVTVTHVNANPVFTSAIANTSQTLAAGGTPVAVAATDPDGDTLTYSLISGPLPGSVTLAPGGTFSGTVDTANSYPVTIRVSDGNGGTAMTTLTILVTNSAPVVTDDTDSTASGTPVTTPVRFNDRDANGDTLVVATVTQGTNGTVAIDATSGNPTYSPKPGFVGTDTYTYTVSDGHGGSATGTVTITVGNAPPSYTTAGTNTAQNVAPGAVPVALAATDPNLDPLTFSLRAGSVLPPGLTLAANGTFGGLATTSGTYSVIVDVRDGRGGLASTTLVLTVPNAAPVAVADSAATGFGQPVVTAVRFNDTDANGDTLTVSGTTNGAHGSVSQDPTTGNPVYTPAAGYSGSDSYTYTVSDGHGGTATGTVSVDVGNGAPTFTGAAENTGQSVTPAATPVRVVATDPNGDALTYALVSGPLPGSVVLASDGTFSGIVTTAGGYTVRISADDGRGGVATTTLLLTVPNAKPVAVPDSVTVPFGGSVSTDVRFNDTDANGDTLVVSGFSQGTSGGVVSTGPAGTVTYAPPAGFSGTDTYTYDVSDGHNGTATGTVTVTVGNGSPSYSGLQSNTAQTVVPGTAPAALDASDPNGDPLTFTLVGGALPSGVVLDSSGVFMGGPTAAGTYPVTIVVNDGNGGSDSTLLTLTVPNVAPTPAPDTANTAYMAPVLIPVLLNDSDPNGDALTVSAATDGAHGAVTVNGGGDVTYTPAIGFSGIDTFTYTATDGTTPVTANVTVTVANAPPAFTSAGTNSAQTVEPGAWPVALLARDPNGDPLTYGLASGTLPAGIILNADGTFSGQVTAAGTFIVTVSVTDRKGTPVPQTLTLTVPNRAPTAVADADTTSYATPVTTDVLANDTDPNGDPLTVSGVTNGAHGSVSLNGTGTPVYTPAAGFSGTDTYSYTATDGTNPVVSTVTITVGNGPPAFTAAAANTAQTVEPTATPASVTATDPNGDQLVYAVAAGALPAGVSLTPSGTFAGSPSAAGTYTATVTVDDGNGGSDSTILVITVPNRAPTAADDTAATAYLTPVASVVRFNDRDPNGDFLTVATTTNGAHGTVALNAAGNPVYTPAVGFSGTDTYTYTVTDTDGLSSLPATVTVTVGDAPPSYDAVGSNTAQTVQPGSAPTRLLATDPNSSDTLTYAVSGGSLPTGITMAADGTFGGSASTVAVTTASITVSDGKGGSDLTSLRISVPNVAPNAVADSDSTATATPVTTLVRGNDTDPNGDALTVSSVTQGARGSVVLNGAGNPTYTPGPGFAGFDSYTYTVRDPGGLTSTATVTIAVGNAPPAFTSAAGNRAQTVQPGSRPVPLLATDPNNDTLSYRITVGALPTGMSLGGDGSFTGAASTAGTFSVTAQVSDGNGGLDTVGLTLTVPNVAPVAVDDADATAAGTRVVTAVLGNDRDPNGDAIAVNTVTQPAHGTVALDAVTGNPAYTPATGFTGDDTYSYRIRDAAGLVSAAATVTVSVANAPPVYTSSTDNTAQLVQPGSAPQPVVATDPNGDALTYVVTGGGLPPGVTLTSGGTFGGSVIRAGTYTVSITADDGHLGTTATTLTVTVPDVAPTAADDNASTTYVNAVPTAVLSNDSDANGDPLVVTGVGAAVNGTVTFTTTGTTYTPAAGFSGSDSYQYTIEDPAHHVASAWVHVTVGNAAPVFTSATDNSSQSLAPGATPRAVAAVDPNIADTVTYTATGTLPAGVVLASGGTFSGTVKLAGTFTLTVTATDNHGAASTHTLVLVVAQVGPVAVDDSDSTAYLTAKAIDVLANDTDANGDARTVTAVGGAAHGTVTFTATGVTYTPAAGFSGTDTFDYTVSDGAGSDVGTVTVTVANAQPAFTAATTNDLQDVAPGGTPLSVVASDPNTTDLLTYDVASGTLPAGMTLGSGGSFSGKVKAAGDYAVTIEVLDGHGGRDTTDLLLRVPNVAPTAVADGALTGTASAVTTSVLTNDSDANGDPITVTGVTNGSHGAVTFTPTTATYTPNATYAGSDTYTYTISDGQLTATATVVISVSNAAPVFTGSADNTAQNVAPGSTPGSLVATDANNDPLTYSLTGGALPLGVTVGTDGSFTGTVARAGTYRATFSVDDGRGGTAATALVITVDNLAPTAVNDTATTTYATAVTTSVLANDSDANGDPLSVVGLGIPSHGTVSLSNGRPTYTPFAGYSGPDSYTYTVSDGALSARGTVTVSVANAAPVFTAAADNSAQTVLPGATPRLVVATDPNVGDTVTYTAAGTLPIGVTLGGNGGFAGTVQRAGTFTLTLTATDNHGATAAQTLVIDVPDLAPIAADDSASTAYVTPVDVDVLANDTDPNGTLPTVVGVSPPAHGTTTFTATGTSYVPAAGFSGTDSYTYTIGDGTLTGLDTGRVTVTVGNAAPAFTADTTNDDQDVEPGATPVAVLAVDPNAADLLTYTLTGGAPPAGMLLTTTGGFTGTAKAAGDFTVTITVRDGNGGSDSTVLTLHVLDRAPVVVDDSATTASGAAVTTDVLANDRDPNGKTLLLSAATNGAHGTVVASPTGTTYTPAAGYAGTDTYTYTASDGTLTSVGTVRVSISNAPPAFDGATTTNTAQTVLPGAVPVPLVAGDPNSDPLTFAVAPGSLPPGITLNPDGTFGGAATGRGTYPVTVTVTDGSATDSIILTITVPNLPPALTASASNTAQSVFPGSVPTALAGTDANGDPFTFAVTGGSLPVGITLSSDGTFSGTATTAGSFPVTVTVTDNGGQATTSTFTIDIPNVAPAFTGAPTNTAQSVPQGGTPAAVAATDANADTLTYTVTSGAPPPGLTLNPNGTWSGTPTGPGTTTFDVSASDGITATVVHLTITVPSSPPVVPGGPNVVETVAAGSTPAALAATVFGGGPATYVVTIGSLPPGITLNPDGTFTGLAGPVGSWTVSVDVTGGGATTSGTVTINVPNTAPAFTTSRANSAQSVVAGDPFASLGATDANGDALTYAITSGTLPPGVVLAGDGTFSGTAGPVGAWPVTVTVTDSHGGTTSHPLTLTVPNSPPVFVPAPVVGAYGATPPPLVATDPNGDPLTYTVVSGSLPPGLTLGADGVFAGTPTGSGSFSPTIAVTDSHGATVSSVVAVTVPAAPPVPAMPPVLGPPVPPVVGPVVPPVVGPVVPASPSPSASPSTTASPSVVPSVRPSVQAVSPSPSTPAPVISAAPTAAPVVVPSPVPSRSMEQSRTTGLDQPVTVDLTGRGASPTHLRLADAPQHGSVALGPDGTAVYTPDTGFSGEDSFTYTFTGGSGVAISGVVHVRVGDAVRLPRTGADTARDIAAGLGLLLVGFLLLAVGRRRTDDDEPETA